MWKKFFPIRLAHGFLCGAHVCSFVVDCGNGAVDTMLFRVKYLLGIMATLFGLLYMLFGVVGLSGAENVPIADRLTPFLLGGIHLVLALVLFWTSMRERRSEYRRLHRLLRLILHHQSSLSAREFAELAGISLSEAHDFLLLASRRRSVVPVSSSKSLRVWSRASMN